MRQLTAARLLELARQLAGSAQGLSLEDIQSHFEVSRRTAERMRDALLHIMPEVEEVPAAWPKRYRLSGGLTGAFLRPTADELAELASSAARLEQAGLDDGAKRLRAVELKLRGALRQDLLRRLEPDLEVLIESEALAMRAGPRPLIPTEILAAIREAFMAGNQLRFAYRAPEREEPLRHTVVPLGLIYGNRHYLVACWPRHEAPMNFRLDRISGLSILERPAVRPERFDLKAYCARAFGAFQEEPVDVALRFDAAVAEDALAFRFHPTQIVEPQNDGTVIVRFRAGGRREMCWHLFTWGGTVAILEPVELREMMRTLLDEAGSRLDARRDISDRS